MAISESKNSLATRIKYALPLFAITVLILFFDQLTKTIVRKNAAIKGTIEVISGFFEINYAENTGAAFGMFRGQNIVFIIVSFFAIAFMFIYYKQFKSSMWMKISLGFLLGGALGNLTDRIFFGFVTDFIRVRIWFFRFIWWPNFNIADAAVTVGVIMLLIGLLKYRSVES